MEDGEWLMLKLEWVVKSFLGFPFFKSAVFGDMGGPQCGMTRRVTNIWIFFCVRDHIA